jgi:hypothetical protein
MCGSKCKEWRRSREQREVRESRGQSPPAKGAAEPRPLTSQSPRIPRRKARRRNGRQSRDPSQGRACESGGTNRTGAGVDGAASSMNTAPIVLTFGH